VRVDLIAVPYDSGMRDARMGRGPGHLLELGLANRLSALGADVALRLVEPPPGVYPTEIRMALELQRAVAGAVSESLARASFPLVLSGNCSVSVGVSAALTATRGAPPAVCWFDAHADFNTPESTIGGFLDGMALSMLTGHCWRELAAQVPGFAPVPEAQVLLIGTRDVDPLEKDLLDASRVRVSAHADAIAANVDAVVSSACARDVYLHLDLDVLDPGEGRANSYAAAGGLSRAGLLAAIDDIASHGLLRAASLTAYDPDCDTDGRVGAIAIEAAERIVRAASTAIAT
jgi:arginase